MLMSNRYSSPDFKLRIFLWCLLPDEMRSVDTRGTYHQGDSWCQPQQLTSAPLAASFDAQFLELATGASPVPLNWIRIPRCQKCGYNCEDYQQFITHMKDAHGSQQYWCEICYKGFDTNPKLKTHARQHEKRYACNVCGRKFGQKGDLHNHMRTHTGEEPYGCQFCDKRFKSPAHRSWHVRKIHKQTLTTPQKILLPSSYKVELPEPYHNPKE